MTKKVNKGVKKVFRNLKAFSLVELIIVIAIVAILSVAGFLTLQKRISQSRDSARLSDLETIKKSLTVSYADSSTSETYPMPDEAETVTGEDGETVWHQGYFGDNAMDQIDNLNKLPKDPGGTGYEYSVTSDQQTYEVYAKLENGEKVSMLTNEVYAEEGRHIAKEGNYNGYIIGTDGTKYNLYNSPSLYLSSGTQLTSGAVNNVYQEGEAADSSVTVTGVDITDLKDDDTSNDDTVYDKVKNKFGLETVDEAEKVVKRADGDGVDTSSSDSEANVEKDNISERYDTEKFDEVRENKGTTYSGWVEDYRNQSAYSGHLVYWIAGAENYESNSLNVDIPDSGAGLDDIIDNSSNMSGVASSSTAMNEVASSSIAVDSVTSDANAMDIINDNDIAEKKLYSKGLIIYSDNVTVTDSQWTTIEFPAEFNDPIIVGTENEVLNFGPGSFQVRNVSSNSAEIRVCSHNQKSSSGHYCDFNNGSKKVGFIVVDKSRIGNIDRIDAGSISNVGNNQGDEATANYNLSSSNVLVFNAPASNNTNNERGVEGRLYSEPTSSSAAMYVCSADDGNCNGSSEDLHWIAINETINWNINYNTIKTSSMFGSSYDFSDSDSTKLNEWYERNFNSNFDNTPVVIAEVQGNSGGDQTMIDQVHNVGTDKAFIHRCEIEDENTSEQCDGHNNNPLGGLSLPVNGN